MLLHAVADSLRVLPPGTVFALDEGGRAIAGTFGVLFSSALRTAAPVVVALLVTNAALAILSRAVPQLNAMMVSFPITIGVGLLMFAVSMPVVSSVIARWVEVMPAGIDRLLPQLQP